MRRSLLALGLGILAVGCAKVEDKVVGTWTAGKDTITVSKDKNFTLDQPISFRGQSLGFSQKGSWKIENGDIVLQTESVNNIPIANVRQRMMAGKSGKTEVGQKLLRSLERPGYYKPSSDGKRLEVDRTKDKGSDAIATFTKTG